MIVIFKFGYYSLRGFCYKKKKTHLSFEIGVYWNNQMLLEGPTTNTEMHVIQKWVPLIPKQACLCAHTLLRRCLLFIRLLILESNASFWVSSSQTAFDIWLLLGWFAKGCAWGGGTFKLTQPFLHPALALALLITALGPQFVPVRALKPIWMCYVGHSGVTPLACFSWETSCFLWVSCYGVPCICLAASQIQHHFPAFVYCFFNLFLLLLHLPILAKQIQEL